MMSSHPPGNPTHERHLAEAALASYIADNDAATERAAAESHLAACAICSAALEDQRFARRIVAAAHIARPLPDGLRSRILARMAEAGPAPQVADETVVSSGRPLSERQVPGQRAASTPPKHPARPSPSSRFAAFGAVAAVLALVVASAAIFGVFAPHIRLGAPTTRTPTLPALTTLPTIVPSQVTISKIQMFSAADGWAVGTQGFSSLESVGVILRYNQGRWRAVWAIPRAALYSLSMDSPDDGWAIGTDYSGWTQGTRDAQGKVATPPGGATTLMLRYNHGVWTKVTGLPDLYLSAIGMTAPDDGWAAASNSLLHYDGARWSRVPGYTADGQPFGATDIAMLSRTEGWAVGTYSAVALRYSGGQWQPVQEGPHLSLGALSLVSATEGWAVGAGGGSKVGIATFAHLHNGTWSFQQFQDLEGLADVSMASATDGWAVGGASTSLLMRYTSGRWVRVPSPTTAPLRTIQMASATEGWATGVGGLLLHYQGGAWKAETWDVALTGQAIPVVAQPTAVPAPTPTLDPNFRGLTLSGEIAGQLRAIQTTCLYNGQVFPRSFSATVRGMLGSAQYSLSMNTSKFAGVGTYVGQWSIALSGQLPDGRDSAWQLAPASGAGTVTIGPDGRSGTVDAQLTRQGGGTVHVTGPWSPDGPCDSSLG